MCEERAVYVVPVHIGAECLVSVDVEPCIAQFAACLVAVEYLGYAGREEEGCGAVNHVVHVGIAVI